MPRNESKHTKGTKHTKSKRKQHDPTSPSNLFTSFKRATNLKKYMVWHWLNSNRSTEINIDKCKFKDYLKNATEETLNILVLNIKEYYQYPNLNPKYIFNNNQIINEYKKLSFFQKQAFMYAIDTDKDQIDSSFSKKLSDFQIKLDDKDKKKLNNLVELYNKEEDINIKILLVLADAINSNFRI